MKGVFLKMKSVNIKLPTIEAVQKFVDTVCEFDEDISLSSGKYIVDAKSIMGIFSLDLRMPICMSVDSDDCEHVFRAVEEYIAER